MRLQDMWVELKLQSRTTYVRCFQVVYTRQHNSIQQPEINSDKLTENNS